MATARAETPPLGHWKLDAKGAEEIVADATTHSLHGRAVGFDAETMRGIPGKIDQAAHFPQAGAISLGEHATALGRLKDFTISAWIQYDGGSSRMIFSFSDDTLGHRLQVEVNNGALSFGWVDGGGWTNYSTGPLVWEPGQWYHVVFVNDSILGKSILRSNDLVRQTHPNTLSPADLKAPVTHVEIGSLNGQYPFNGSIDDVRLFDSALPLGEQLALYESHQIEPDAVWENRKRLLLEEEKPRQAMVRQIMETAAASAKEGLLVYWKMDENSENHQIMDSSGNQFHALCVAQTSKASVPGKTGRALRFPEAGLIYLDNPAEALVKLTDFTISLWFQPSSDSWRFHQRLFTFTGGAAGSYYLMELDKGALSVSWQDANVSGRISTPVLKWKAGEWYHLVFVNDSEAGQSLLRSNDLALSMDTNSFSPSQMSAPITRIDMNCTHYGTGLCQFIGCRDDFLHFNSPPPIGRPRAKCMDLGALDDVKIYNRALSLEKQLALYDAANNEVETGRNEAIAALMSRGKSAAVSPYEYFLTNEKPTLSGMDLELKSEWLFQAEGEELHVRIKKEIQWTTELLERLRKRAPALNLSTDMNALNEIIPKASRLTAESKPSQILSLYFQLRELKRRILFKSPEIDFSSIICVDAPAQNGNESLSRGEMHARHGSRLLLLDDIAGTLTTRQLAPTKDSSPRVAMFGFDLSYDAQRVLFCMKPDNQKAYHLYETDINGNGLRQITSGAYSDIDPVYLPGGGYAFLSTRGNVYVQCGPWARSYVLTRCDDNGSNIYILSPGTEAEYSPSLLDDGRILFTRWEYVDKGPQRIQSLWTMRPDGTAANTFWGNQSVWPDHLGDGRQIPGTNKVMFTGTSHPEISAGCIGIVDPKEGNNYPDGIWKVTQELPWPEAGEGPTPSPGATSSYHTSGQYATYHSPYPLSDELFLVSAGRGWRELLGNEPDWNQKLFLMDIHGNRELIYQGSQSILYAQPVRPRKPPFALPNLADFPGSEADQPTVRPGVFFSSDIFADVPIEVRQQGKFLRIVENMPKNYSTGIVHSGGKPFGAPGPNVAWGPNGSGAMVSGPATGLAGALSVKQVIGTVPIRPDGSVHFTAPPCRMLYFQVLDQYRRCIHTMRSWVSVRPGEYRGCVGCHESKNKTPAPQMMKPKHSPDQIEPPPWGVRSLSYIKDIQPVFDRACGQCHQGEGEAAKTLDLTLRPARHPAWNGGIFPEPYVTLMIGKNWQPVIWTGWTSTGYLAVPPVAKTRYDTMPPLSCLSPKSLLIAEVMDEKRCGKFIKPEELQMLIAWVDLWGLYRSDEDCREIEDPPAASFTLWGAPPKCESAPRVRPEYSQDEYTCPEDRMPKQETRRSQSKIIKVTVK